MKSSSSYFDVLHLQGIPGTIKLPLTAHTYLLIAFAHSLWNFQVPSIMHTHTHTQYTHTHIHIHIANAFHCEWAQLTMQASLVHISVMVPFVHHCWASWACVGYAGLVLGVSEMQVNASPNWTRRRSVALGRIWAASGSSPGNAYF